MQRLTRCVVCLVALAFAWACSGDPTDNQGTPTLIVATPGVMTVAQGDSQAVIASLVDEDGQSIQAEFSFSNVGSGITVTGPDPTFLSVLGGEPIGRQARFFVTGVDLVQTTFTVNSFGLTTDVRVTVTPTALAATFSNTSPALGEAITLTMPAGTILTATSVITFGGAAANIISVAPDGSSVTLFVPPNLAATPATITKVGLTSNPALTFTLETTGGVTTPVVDSIPATLSTTTPAANQAVTLTRTDPNFTFLPTAQVSVGADATPLVFSVAGDGSSITFLPTPGSSGNVSVNGVDVAGFSLTLPSTTPSITVGPLTEAAGTASPATAPTIPTPAAGEASAFFDLPNFGAAADHFYKLVIPSDGDFTITLDWDIGSDIDMFLCPSPGAITGACDFTAATGAHPESATFTLTAGTHFVVADDFGADAAGATIKITIQH